MIWQFAKFDPAGPFSEHVDGAGAATMLRLLGEIEAQTHGQLFDKQANRNARGGTKRIPLEHLCGDARRRVQALQLDDNDAVWEIRAGGKPRVWALRHQRFASVLWWDPEHKVCPSTRKNN